MSEEILNMTHNGYHQANVEYAYRALTQIISSE
jgi:hypothetical protein